MASYPISALGCDQETIADLKSVGIRTTARLLEAASNPKGRKLLADKIGVNQKQILCWANQADRMRIKGMGKEYAELLQHVGVDTVNELRYRNPTRLTKSMAAANAKRKLVRILPSERAVVRWIEQAKKLPLKISY
jgi:predicted RecB family nuclease